MTIRWLREPDPIATEIDGALVVFSVPAGKYLSLNKSASVIWERLAEPASEDELTDALVARFRVDSETAAKGVRKLLDDLTKIKVIAPQR